MGGTGKKKIEIKKILDNEKRFVTFCKRRKGLFKKVEELGVLTGCRMAAVVFSPAAEKPHTCGDVTLIDQFINDCCADHELVPRPESEVEVALKNVDEMNELTGMRSELERIRETILQRLNIG